MEYLLKVENVWISTGDLARKFYKKDRLTGTDHGTVASALGTLLRRKFVVRERAEYKAKRKSRSRANHKRKRRKIWMWKITKEGLKAINGDSR